MSKHFLGISESPYMLDFHRVADDRLKAVTHADGTARVQSVAPSENQILHRLLKIFRAETGAGVLCNTSLNRKGCGFINKTSDVISFAAENKIRSVVINAHLWTNSR